MMIKENIILAYGNLYGNKLRTLLSLLGIMIGVASVIIITTLGESATANVQKEIAKEGMDLITVEGGWADKKIPGMYDPELGRLASREIEGIRRVTPVKEVGATVLSENKKASVQIKVVRPEYFEINRLNSIGGTLFPTDDGYFDGDEIILGYKAAQTFFPAGHSLGSKVTIEYEDEIIGQYIVRAVLVEKGAGMMNSYDNAIFLPYETYSRKVERIREVSSWMFQIRPGVQGDKVSKELTTWYQRFGQDSFFIMSASSVSTMYKSVSKTLKIVLGGIAAISLLVGGIGIMNIMLVSVTERIKEVGIRMALGATPGNILSQFLVEAVCLTFLGGFLGMALGAGVGFLITKIMNWPFTVSPAVCLLSVGFSIKVGLFFGLYPAYKASRLDPILALSRE